MSFLKATCFCCYFICFFFSVSESINWKLGGCSWGDNAWLGSLSLRCTNISCTVLVFSTKTVLLFFFLSLFYFRSRRGKPQEWKTNTRCHFSIILAVIHCVVCKILIYFIYLLPSSCGHHSSAAFKLKTTTKNFYFVLIWKAPVDKSAKRTTALCHKGLDLASTCIYFESECK